MVFRREYFCSMADFDGVTALAMIKFEKVPFWVRMFDLPLACVGADIGHQIGSTMGFVEEVEIDENGMGWGQYLQARTSIDLTKPLSRGRWLNVMGKQVWIWFQYEWIPRFCFNCGVVLHRKSRCLKKANSHFQGERAEYGPWLRVSPPRRCPRARDGRGWERTVFEQSFSKEGLKSGKKGGSLTNDVTGALSCNSEMPAASLGAAV